MGIIALCYGDGTSPKTIKGLTLKGCKNLWEDSKEKVKNTENKSNIYKGMEDEGRVK